MKAKGLLSRLICRLTGGHELVLDRSEQNLRTRCLRCGWQSKGIDEGPSCICGDTGYMFKDQAVEYAPCPLHGRKEREA